MDQSEQKQLESKERKIYSGQAARIMKLLGSGCLQKEAARAVGVDESYVSQLMAEPDFRSQVNEIVAKEFAQQSEIDANYTKIEQELSKRLLQNVGHMFGTDQMLRVLKFANEAKRKVAPVHQNGEANGEGFGALKPVALILPMNIAREFMFNPQNEIVGVGGEVLDTLPATRLPTLVEKHKKELLEQKIGFKILPNGTRSEDPWGNL